MRQTIIEYLTDLFDLFYPNVCVACSGKLMSGEEVLCFKCESELPQSEHWNNPENTLMKRFWGRVDVQGAATLFQFQKGENVQQLLHQLKYRGRKDVGDYLGKMFGHLLKQENSVIKNIDLIVPVPLHWKKLKKRGYNQCDPFAEALSTTLNIPWSSTALERVHENVSQTGINRFDRYGNVAHIFSVADATQLKGKHILLVDDVVTTGATAEACLQTILSVENTKVSFAAIAVALR
ncbi:MAG: putative amidophosphoribosyltransferase [Bacteroidota bacterium]|nr:putative amidophosphoribosyltransferase [Bacteroidota bacterium]